MSKWIVTAEVSISELAKVDIVVEADTKEEAIEKAYNYEGGMGDDYNNVTSSTELFGQDSCEVLKVETHRKLDLLRGKVCVFDNRELITSATLGGEVLDCIGSARVYLANTNGVYKMKKPEHDLVVDDAVITNGEFKWSLTKDGNLRRFDV